MAALSSGGFGYVLDSYRLAAGRIWNVFDSLSTTYAMLDAMLPAEGAYVSRRPRRVNVSPDELEAVRRT